MTELEQRVEEAIEALYELAEIVPTTIEKSHADMALMYVRHLKRYTDQ